MKSFSELAQSVKFSKQGSQTMLMRKDCDLEFIGAGRSAFVFKIRSTDKVLKVFFPPFTEVAKEEAEVYKALGETPFYPVLYDSGDNYIVIDFVQGNTLFSCLEKGIPITHRHIQKVDEALRFARKRGLNPSDIHLRNILITPAGGIKLIDVARFRQTKDCSQWDDLKNAFYAIYSHRIFPKKIPASLLNLIAFIYKKCEACLQKTEKVKANRASRRSFPSGEDCL
ncbi:protein kinase family protein [Bacillus sp. V33-4]|uniref:protein kinase family protein n=1 Tax=Bacillus sp. V33-4 TaxID=2054169 RepID=UPI002155AF53|nr:protein kinase family protein [Bacillus sp. V33-4]